MQDIAFSIIGPAEMRSMSAQLAAVHQAAFDEADARAERYRVKDIPEMSACRGLHILTAWNAGHLVGFVLGYDAVAIPTWFANVSQAVAGTPVANWLHAAWYLADFAVHPEFQNHGIGKALHNGIMLLSTDRPRMLVTWHGDHPAKRFYLRLGWCEVVPDLEYHPGGPRTSLMEFVGIEPDR